MATPAPAQQSGETNRNAAGAFLGNVNHKTRPLQEFLTKFNNDWTMNLAGMLAYNLLTAILPIAIALFGLLGLLLGGHDTLLERSLLLQIPTLFPGGSEDAMSAFLMGAISQIQKDAGILLIIAIALAIFGGSRLFITVEGCLNIIYRVRPRPFIRQNVMAFSMLLLFIVLIPIMFFASTLPAFLLSFLGSQPQLRLLPFVVAFTNSFITTYLLGIVSSLIASFMLFEAIYFVVPNQRISWRNSWRGALAASLLLELFLQLFPYYTANFLKGYSGAIGLAVIILLFFYYFALILLLGAEVNAFFFERIQPIPNDLVTFVSTMAGKLNEDQPGEAATHHTDARPTNREDAQHIARAQEQQHEPSPRTPPARKGRARLMAIVSVLFGSALTTAIQLTRLRRYSK